MKKILLLFAVIFAFASTQSLMAQAKKYPLFEHFTQASCGPCATQNPAFQELYFKNLAKAHHIAFHTWWPGVDPMYNYNTTEVRTMVTHYNVQGVPDIEIDGTNLGTPTAVTQTMIDNAGTSPVAVKVKETRTATDVTAEVTVDVVGAVASGDYALRVAAVEYLIQYATPPGTNGEKDFPNVFRKFQTSDLGDDITLTQGQSQTFTFTYPLDAVWKADQIYTLAWVFEKNTKEVLNSGASYDVAFDATSNSEKLQAGVVAGNNFNGKITNGSNADMQLEITLTSTQPGDWDAKYNFQGADYAGTNVFTVTPGEHNYTLKVKAGATAAVGKYNIEVRPVGNFVSTNLNSWVISGVTDLVAHRASSDVDLNTPHRTGLTLAGNQKFDSMEDELLIEGINNGALDGVDHIYYGIGWNFPAMTEDMANALAAFTANGGNLLISGQDYGWDVFDPTGSSNFPANQSFYSNVLQAKYFDDGTSARSRFTPVTTDPFYAAAGVSTISRPYGSTNIYPDKIGVNGPDAKAIFTYNTVTDVAGVRTESAGYKTVLIGIGVEQIASPAVRDAFMKITHDWFHGLITSTEFDAAMAALQMGQNMPNPANDFTIIPFNGEWKSDLTLQVTDLNGRVLSTQEVAAGISTVKLTTSNLASGIYFYQLTDGEHIGAPHKLVVQH